MHDHTSRSRMSTPNIRNSASPHSLQELENFDLTIHRRNSVVFQPRQLPIIDELGLDQQQSFYEDLAVKTISLSGPMNKFGIHFTTLRELRTMK
jgi:hypothetical protein